MTPSRLALMALVVVAPLAAGAQPGGPARRIGYLSGASGFGPREEAFRRGLRELAHVEGQNLVIEWRFADGREDRLGALATELAHLKPDVVVTDGTRGTGAMRSASSSIPIVMAADSDPIGSGYVASLARPGGNVTGLTTLVLGLSRKRLEVLAEAIPGISRVGVVWNPESPPSAAAFEETRVAAGALRMQVQSLEVRGRADLESVVQAAARGRTGALAVLSDAQMFAHRGRILELAARQRLPTMHNHSLWVEAGGLLSYGTHFPDLHRRAAAYVDKILKGARPADLPVEQPTKFELVINLKTAKALGLALPPALLARADEVIR